MRYYIFHKGKKIYFSFDLEGFKMAQLYIEKYKLKSRRLYTENSEPLLWWLFCYL